MRRTIRRSPPSGLSLATGTAIVLLAFDLSAAGRGILYEPVHEDLAAAIRIQLAGGVELISGPELEAQSLPDRLATVRRDLSLRTASFGLWVETSTLPVSLTVFVVGDRGGPFVETASVAGTLGPDLERALALKVLEIVSATRVDSTPVVTTEPYRLRFSLEAGALGAYGDRDSRAQGGLALSAGGRLETGQWLIELHTGANLVSSFGVAEDRGTIQVREWSWKAGVRALLPVGPIWIGLSFDGNLRVLNAVGQTAGGSRDRASLLLPSIVGGADVRVPIWSMLDARLFAGAGLNVERHQLAINAQPLLDLGTWYGTAQLSLVLSIP